MTKLITGFLLLLSLNNLVAQESDITAKGKKVYVETRSKNDNAIKTKNNISEKLEEWSYWRVVDKASAADFIISTETTASKGITATSWGGTSYKLVAKFIDKKGEVFWESNGYKSSPNGSNGFNSSEAVAKKLVRDLKKRFK